MIIQYNKEEQEAIYDAACERYYGHREKGTYEINKFHANRLRPDHEGVYGEWAVADLLGVDRPGNEKVDEGWDVEWNGKNIDVKSTSYKTGRLLVPVNRPPSCTHLALAIVDLNNGTVRLPGLIDIVAFEYIAKTVNFGRGDSLAVEQDELVAWEKVLDAGFLKERQESLSLVHS